jgi:hypothetical protein
MKILITGGTGLVGTALTEQLRERGDTVGYFVRGQQPVRPDDVPWNPATGEMQLDRVEGADAIVNLAGASIGDGRWSDKRKRELVESRVNLTWNLIANLARLHKPPHTIVSASAVGYYGDRADETLTEQSAAGSDFLAQLARDWEAAAMKGEGLGARVAITRFGIILSKKGGALPRMLFPFKVGVGGRLGSGKQWMSWIALDDITSAIMAILDNPSLRGPLNLTAPNPVRNLDFTKALGNALHRPTIFPVPAFILKTILGEMGESLLLSSQRALPDRLSRASFHFAFPDLEAALAHVLGQP